MGKAFENIDDLFKEGLASYSAKPSPDIWDSIQTDLSKNKKVFLIPYWIKIAASIIFLIGVGAISSYFFFADHSGSLSEKLVTIEPKELNEVTTEHSKVEISAEKQQSADYYPINRLSDSKNKSETNIVSTSKMVHKQVHQPAFEDMSETEIASTSGSNAFLSHKIIQLSSEVDETLCIKNKKDNQAQLEESIILANMLALNLEENPLPDEADLRWQLGGQAGPQYAYREISSNTMNSIEQASINDKESGILAYAGGVNVQFKTSKRLSVQSGIYYSKIGQSVSDGLVVSYGPKKTDNIIYQSPNATVESSNSIGNISFSAEKNIPPPSVKNSSVSSEMDYATWRPSETQMGSYTIDTEQQFEYLEIPLFLRYKIVDRKFDFHLLGGLSTNFMVSNKVYAVENDQLIESGETEGVNTVNYSTSLGMGIAYPFAKRLNFSLEPVFKYYLNPINNEGAVSAHPYTLGLMTGITYSF